MLCAAGNACMAPPGRAPGRSPTTGALNASPRISVGPTVQVSATNPRATHYEVVVAAHPRDPSRLVAGSIIYPETAASYGTVVYSTADGGASWQPSLEGQALDNTGDPAVTYGPDGAALYVASHIPLVGERHLLLFRLQDGGTRWDGAFPLTYLDREYVTVDATNGPRRGHVYVNGNNRIPRAISDFVLFRSTDGGHSFVGPGTRTAFGSVTATVMGNAVVASDGTVIGAYVAASARGERPQEASLYVGWSIDGALSVGGTAIIDRYRAGGDRKGTIAGNANAEPALAIDATLRRFKDRLYVVWPDSRSGHSTVMFSSSSDSGKTWAPSRAIVDRPTSDTTDQSMPEIAVNRDGVVGISWYDRRDRADNLGWDVRFSASLDGGATFLPSVKVSAQGSSFPPGASRVRRQVPARPTPREQVEAGRDSFRYMGGDTAGLAVDAAGIFHPVWVDNHTGVPQIWTATVTVQAP